MLRAWIKGLQIGHYHGNIPLDTLFINVSGTLLLAFILTVACEVWAFDSDVRLGLTTGLLGAYTTFSTLCKETVGLLQGGNFCSAVSYVTASVLLGLAAASLGAALARKIGSATAKRRKGPGAAAGEDGGVD